jgi:hypothetical protein
MVLFGYSGTRGKLIHAKKLMLKISCQTLFKRPLAQYFLGKQGNFEAFHENIPVMD